MLQVVLDQITQMLNRVILFSTGSIKVYSGSNPYGDVNVGHSANPYGDLSTNPYAQTTMDSSNPLNYQKVCFCTRLLLPTKHRLILMLFERITIKIRCRLLLVVENKRIGVFFILDIENFRFEKIGAFFVWLCGAKGVVNLTMLLQVSLSQSRVITAN